MRTLSIFTTVATFTLSVSAINNNIQDCVNSLDAADAQLLVLKSAVDAFSSTEGFLGAFKINNKEHPLEDLIKNANTACCAITTTVSDEEASTVFDLIGSMVPDITGSLDSIITKKPDFDAVAFVTTFLKVDIKALADLLKILDGCLITVAPDFLLASAQAYIDDINTKIAAAFTAYNIIDA